MLPLADFTLEGSAWRKERNVVSRGGRDGLVLKLYDPPHTAPLVAEPSAGGASSLTPAARWV